MLYVYHNAHFLDYHFKNSSLKNALVSLVAVVDAADLEEAYRLTNNIDTPWHDNPGVKVMDKEATRSTSVGDLIVEGPAGDLSCRHHVVESCGFRELEREEVLALTIHSA
jgi:hypothetical protein